MSDLIYQVYDLDGKFLYSDNSIHNIARRQKVSKNTISTRINNKVNKDTIKRNDERYHFNINKTSFSEIRQNISKCM